MRRFIVNPGTPQAWEITLQAGRNLIGRGDQNDFKIDDPSVSSSHCEVAVSADSVLIRDLGSTNGTFADDAPIRELELRHGQSLRLGAVALEYIDAKEPDLAIVENHPSMRRTTTHALSASARPVSAAVRIHAASPALPLAEPISAERRFCKFHPKSPARYLCSKCNRTFCELCVASRIVGGRPAKTCRACGVECAPLQGRPVAPAAARGFFARLPGVFVYPFRGSGVLVLIVATVVFAGLHFISRGWLSLFTKALALGYLFSYMQALIHSTAAGDDEMPELPGMDEVFGSFFRLAGTVLVAFGIPLGLLIAKLCNVDVPVAVIVGTGILGSLYFPMSFLAVAMKDTVLSANPLVVVPAILKVPLHYIVTAILFAVIFSISQLGSFVTSFVGHATLLTKSWTVLLVSVGLRCTWSFVSVYLLTVNMRILGLLYLANKDKLGWFSR